MAQFSSRPPFNDDPAPHVHYLTGRRTLFDSAGRKSILNYDFEPRPEFERPQNNPTNRMLTCARRAHEGGYLDAFCEGFLEQRNTEHPEIDHAQRVLLRLARVYGTV